MRLSATKLAAIGQSSGFGNQLYDFAGQVPSLDQRFAADKSLRDAVSGQQLITHTRASSGTFVDSSGVLRTAVTNLALNSENFSAATWTLGAVTVTIDAAVSPTGATTADSLLETALLPEVHIIYETNPRTFTTGTQSFYVKPNGRTNAALRFYHGLNDWVVTVFSLTGNGSVTQSSAGSSSGFSAVSSSIVNVGNGWYRISMTATQASRSTFPLALDLCTSSTPTLDAINGAETYLGDITKGVFIWGAQFETTATVGEYVPTTSTINSAPRFDHNPTTGESLGLLIEEARTNLLTASEATDASPWGLAAATAVANNGVAPDGATTADKIVSTGGGNFRAGISVANTTAYTYSVFLKYVAGTGVIGQVGIERFGSTPLSASLSVNLIAGTITNNGAPVTASSITRYPNNWYRVSVTAISTDITTTVVNYAAASGNEFLAWGAQLEAGAFPTSYIPTTTAAATRSADVASITGSNFSSWYRQDEGTLFASAIGVNNVSAATRRFAEITDGTNNERMILGYSTTSSTRFLVVDNGAIQSDRNVTGVNAGTLVKMSAAYKIDDFQQASNGTLSTAGTSGTLPIVNLMLIGDAGGSGTTLNGHIRRLTFWGQRLPNNVLQTLTQ